MIGGSELAKRRFDAFIEEAAGRLAADEPRMYKDFTGLHERAAQLLLELETENNFGIVKEILPFVPGGKEEEVTGVSGDDLVSMLNVIEGLEKIVSDTQKEEEGSVLNLIPGCIVITNYGNESLIEAIGGQKIKAGKTKITIEKALDLAKNAEQAEERESARKGWGGVWLEDEEQDRQTWEAISKEDRIRLSGIRRILSVVGLDPDSITKGKLGVKKYVYKDIKTGEDLSLEEGDRFVEFKARGNEEGVAITEKGRRIEVKRHEEIQGVLPDLPPEWPSDMLQERSLRDLLIDITKRRAAELADAYLTIEQRRGRLYWGSKGFIVENMGFGSRHHRALIDVLRGDEEFSKKWLRRVEE